MLLQLIRFPDGTELIDGFPGHSLTGRLTYIDPFQRAETYSLRTTGRIAKRWGASK